MPFSAKKIFEILKKAKMHYAYDKKTKIYSVRFDLEGKPRILTVRVSPEFLEYSIATEQGKVLEMIRQEGKNLMYVDFRH